MRYVGIFLVLAGMFGLTAVACGSGESPAEFTPTGDGSTGDDGGTNGDAGGGGGDDGPVLIFDSGPRPDSSCSASMTCAQAGANCGQIGDGCGNILQCGTCGTGQTCGGAGTANVCGTPPCTAKTCPQLGFNCGPAGDGCGNQLDCGTCTSPDTCGGAGTASVCGHGMTCVPETCAQLGFNCGPAGDGCGGQLACGTCTGNLTCGGGGMGGVCGAPVCVPKTCAQLGLDCGPAADGCGGLLQCGTCSAPQTCGGAGASNVCGIPSTCTNLCLRQVTCSGNGTTSVTGTVYAPNGVDPLPNVLVYVPNTAVQPFTAGVTCDNCGAAVSGSPLVRAFTNIDGTFTITNMPVGANVPLVIQIGRWRRQITIPNVAQCVNTPIVATLTRFPKNKSEGDIPKMAFVTGAVDALECVLRKVGVDDAEFTQSTGTGRVNLWVGDGTVTIPGPGGGTYHLGGANAGAGTGSETTLVGTPATLAQYDAVFFPCKGAEATRTTAQQTDIINYSNAGGRIFATHFSYVWLFNDAPFSGTALWNVNQCDSFTTPSCAQQQGYPPDQIGFINTTFPKGLALAQWLQLLGASTTLGQIAINTLRWDTNNPGVVAPAQEWMQIQDTHIGNVLMDYTFNTPVGALPANQCGRVLFNDFHVENHGYINSGSAYGLAFPAECAGGAMTPQEKLLEFMIFDLGSCVTADVPTCTPKTCAQQNIGCGAAGDGCGAVIQCGTCPMGQTCGGGGTPSQCGAPMCTPRTCAQQGLQCGPAGDGCGNVLQCGTCPVGQTCGGGGMPGVCGTQSCTPKTCAQQNISCGPAGDGCGGLLQCGSCPMGQTCGGGGVPGVCGGTQCVPETCAQLGANCGAVADGCGGILQCGTCSAPQTCGGGGTANVCGGSGPR
jgi:hypothetical protein